MPPDRFSTLRSQAPTLSVEHVTKPLSIADLNDLCDATDAAIEAGGGFGWLSVPPRDVLERYWQGVVTMGLRDLFVTRLDSIICGACQIIHPPKNNQAQAHIAQLGSLFITPWARGYGLSRTLLSKVEQFAQHAGYEVINLDVRDTLDRAIALYESAGYMLVGQHPRYAKVDGAYVGGRYYSKYLDVP